MVNEGIRLDEYKAALMDRFEEEAKRADTGVEYARNHGNRPHEASAPAEAKTWRRVVAQRGHSLAF